MPKGNRMRIKKENGVAVFYFTDESGNQTKLTSKEIVEMKQRGKHAGLRDFVTGERTVALPVRTKQSSVKKEEKEELTQWASFDLYDVQGLKDTDKKEKLPWYKRLFKGGDK